MVAVQHVIQRNMIIGILLLGVAQAASPSPAPPPAPAPASVISCNVGVAMFAPRSDAFDAGTARELDRIIAAIGFAFSSDGVSLVVLPHPVALEPADDARQRALADGRGEKVRQYMGAHGLPADRIAIRPAVTDPRIPDNWGDGALLMLEMPSETWDRVNLKDVC